MTDPNVFRVKTKLKRKRRPKCGDGPCDGGKSCPACEKARRLIRAYGGGK